MYFVNNIREGFLSIPYLYIIIQQLDQNKAQYMELIKKYMKKHQAHIVRVFDEMKKQQKIQATKVFNYLQNSFNKQQFRFEINGKDFFSDDQNQTEMEKLLESYYRMAQNDQSKKFYLYRIQFSFEDIDQILQFWLDRVPNLKVVYIEDEGNEQIAKGKILMSQNQQKLSVQKQQIQKNKNSTMEQINQFQNDDEEVSELLSSLQAKLIELEQLFKNSKIKQQRESLKIQIQELNLKIKLLEQRLKTNSIEKYQKRTKNKIDKRAINNLTEPQKKKDILKSNQKGIIINYKAIFDFYAKQTHLTGVKATFQRIQHESQSINYQKLVHFLRQFNILPSTVEDRKKVHALYIKYCESSRVLYLQGFLSVIDGVINIIQKDRTKQERSEILKQKILEKSTKNGKILNHPFHSLQKQDFRINVNDLSYNFKIKPQDGKFTHEVNESLQKRKKDKEEAKNERSKQKQEKNLKYLKKLQYIDPFSPLVLKNSKILQQKEQNKEPIANLQNMQKYRDLSFNFENYFGIDLEVEAPLTGRQKVKRNLSMKDSYNEQSYRRGEVTLKKIQKIQRDQITKMKNMMSGIIERSNVKMEKLGIPTKQEKSFKLS